MFFWFNSKQQNDSFRNRRIHRTKITDDQQSLPICRNIAMDDNAESHPHDFVDRRNKIALQKTGYADFSTE